MYVVYVQILVIIKQDVGQRDIKRTNNRHLSLNMLKYHKFSFNFGQYKRSHHTVKSFQLLAVYEFIRNEIPLYSF